MKGLITGSGASGSAYAFSDGSSIDMSKVITGTHALDGTIIPVVVKLTRTPSYSKTEAASWSKAYSGTITGTQPYSGNQNWSQGYSYTVPAESYSMSFNSTNSTVQGDNRVGTVAGNNQNGKAFYYQFWTSYQPAQATYKVAQTTKTGTNSGTQPYSGSVNWSKGYSGTATGSVNLTATGTVSKEETIFLPMYYNSLTAMSAHKDGTAIAWIAK